VSARGAFDSRIDKIVIKAMQPKPDGRYQNVSEITTALKNLEKTSQDVSAAAGAKKLNLVGDAQGLPSKPDTPAGKSAPVTPVSEQKAMPVIAWTGIGGGVLAIIIALVFVFVSGPKNSPEAPTSSPQLLSEIPETKPEPEPMSVPEPQLEPTPVPPPQPEIEPEPMLKPEPEPKVVAVPEPKPEPEPTMPVSMPMPAPISAAEGEWVDALASLDVDAARVSGDWMLNSDGAIQGEGGYLDLPQQFGNPSYDIEMTLQRVGGDEDIILGLPIGDAKRIELHLCGWNGRWMGFPVAGEGADSSSNPTRVDSPIVRTQNHDLQIKVRLQDDETARIVVSVDGERRIDWSGPQSEVSDSPDNLGKVRLGTFVTTQWSKLRLRGVSFTPLTPGQVAEKVAELAEEFDATHAGGPAYDAAVAKLNQSYRGALQRFISNGADPVKNAAQAELTRVASNLPLGEQDPPGMPNQVKRARKLYRDEIAKFKLQRDNAGLPALFKQLQALEALQTKMAPDDPNGATMFGDEVAKLQMQIAKISDEAAAAGLASAPGTPRPTVKLNRPNLPLKAPTKPGAVVAWERTGARSREGLGKVPGGLTQTVVAITGSRNSVAALKSNGRVAIWGEYEYTFPKAVSDLDDIVRIRLGMGSSDVHLAAIDEAGKVRLVTAGWGDSKDIFETQAQSLEGVADYVVGSQGGHAVMQNGEVAIWGSAKLPKDQSGLKNVVKIVHGPYVGVAIREDLTFARWGDFHEAIPDDLTRIRDIVFDPNSDQLSGIATLADGSLRTFGSAYQQVKPELERIEKETEILKVETGPYVVAVQTKDRFGDLIWEFFGQGVNKEHCSEKAKNCTDLYLGRQYIIGLRPN
ncbi:MAG: hypothetical protein AAF585_16535, partial [Verrucomicrobiota bacterium]